MHVTGGIEMTATTNRQTASGDRLLKPAAVGALFQVHPKTVLRWSHEGRIGYVETLSGRRLYRESEVRAYLVNRYRKPAARPSSTTSA